MNTELKTPFRIYWDLPAGAADAGHMAIAEQLIAQQILSVDLTAPADCSHWLPLIERLSMVQMALSVTIPLGSFSPALLSSLLQCSVKNLNLAIETSADLVCFDGDAFRGAGKTVMGMSVAVTAENYRQLSHLYAFCIDQGFSLVLPMQRLVPGGNYFALNREERQILADSISGMSKPGKMQVTVHDPFLWRIFFPTLDFPEGRCQAANTMLFITAEGNVLPCPSLPVTLGNFREMSLAAIVKSEKKRNLRERLLQAPDGCVACASLASCFGGCRGRAYVAGGSWDGSDPGCR
jgi:GeoRSP system SPASM domain protein